MEPRTVWRGGTRNLGRYRERGARETWDCIMVKRGGHEEPGMV
jgi:hypothetical protein